MRLSIATKIFVAFAAVVVIFAGVLMYGTYRTQTLYERIQRLNHTVVPVTLLLSDVQTDLKSFNAVLNERDPLVLRRTLQMTRLVYFLPDRFTGRLDRAHTMARQADSESMTGPQRELLDELDERLSDLQARATAFAEGSREFSDIVLNERAGEDPDAYAERVLERQSQLRQEARHLDEEITSLRSELRSSIDRALAQANDAQRSSLYALGGLSGVALLIALGVMAAVVVTVRPLTALTEAAKRIGQGDYRPIEEPRQGKLGADEITLLTREFNSMAESLAERDAKLREQHQKLLKSERLATVGRMTSLITHELRNPLSSINLNSEMLEEALRERGLEDDEVMALLSTIIDEVDRLRDITEEYLVYARLPSPNFEATDLGQIVEGLVDFHLFEWNQEGIEVNLSIADDQIPVRADPNQLRQALLNLVKNAIEASDPGQSIDIEVDSGGQEALVRLRDRGAGIANEAVDNIFEPFFTTKSNGTGLGLAMTQQIIEEHEGDIAVDSKKGHGTTFVITLPLASSDDAPQDAPSDAPAATDTLSTMEDT